jgi:hypothetical protein
MSRAAKKTPVTKPKVDRASLASSFASGEVKTEEPAEYTVKPKKASQAASDKRAFNAPEGDKRLTVNIRKDLHEKLKITAIKRDMTVGEMIEDWAETQL